MRYSFACEALHPVERWSLHPAVSCRILSRVTEAVFDRGDFENAGFPDEFLDLLGAPP